MNSGLLEAPQDMGCASQPNILEEGREAWERLQQHQTWSDWRCVGLALTTGQAEAMMRARTNQPKGKRYCEEFGKFLRENGFDRIDKGARSRLLEVMRHLAAIERWLEELWTAKPAKRFRLNHPQAVLSAWKRAEGETKPRPEPKPELFAIWKNATAEERRAVLDDAGITRVLKDISPALRADITKCLRPTKTGDEVLGERIRDIVDEIRPLLVHFEQHKQVINAKLVAIKRATRGVGKAPVTTPIKIDPIVGKAIGAMGNGAGVMAPEVQVGEIVPEPVLVWLGPTAKVEGGSFVVITKAGKWCGRGNNSRSFSYKAAFHPKENPRRGLRIFAADLKTPELARRAAEDAFARGLHLAEASARRVIAAGTAVHV